MSSMKSISFFLLAIAPVLCVDLDPLQFQTQVLEDETAWVVEFYSPMCGSCKEFTPVWNSLEKKIKSMKTGKINIDNKDGLKIAEKLGVLEEGIPNVQLLAKKGSSISIMKGHFFD
jgi:thioredoxin-like negative regulator of GroEL